VGAASARIVHGDLLTMDPARPRAEAMALHGGRILAVGTRDEAARAAPGAPVTNAPGTVVPGFNDAHVHLLYAGLELRRVDLSRVRSVGELLERIGAAARRGDGWLHAVGNFELDDLAERRYPTRAELDGVSAGRPVFVDQRTHDALVNTAALELAGIGRDALDPPGGRIERGPDGEPTGRLVERPAFDLVYRLLPPIELEARRRALREIQPRFLAAGITAVVEPGLDGDELGAFQHAWADGELLVRTTAMPLVDPAVPLSETLAGLGGTGVRTGFGDERLRLGGVKLYYDGTGSFGTALIHEPWPGEEGAAGPPYGVRVVPEETLHELARFCARERWSLGVHAVGGAAVDEVLAAFAAADEVASVRPLRFTVIHGYLWPSPDAIRRTAQLGVVIALQPGLHWTVAPRIVELFGEERAAVGMNPVRSWLDGGALVAGGSDGPDFPLAPLHGIWQACTRAIRGREEPLGPDEAISAAEALELWTWRAAHAAFAEHERGRLAPGLLADWVALSADPLAVPPGELRELEVLQTAVGGEVVHEA
jgi:predicted amidohydrolase YtcJ